MHQMYQPNWMIFKLINLTKEAHEMRDKPLGEAAQSCLPLSSMPSLLSPSICSNTTFCGSDFSSLV